MTPSGFATGTDRVAWVAENLDAETVINIQGDEPLIEPGEVDQVASLLDDPDADMGTLVKRITSVEELCSPGTAKVVVDDRSFALYFSRSPVPFRRNAEPGLPTWKHLGLYGYRRAALDAWTSLPPHPLERAESLEQLRALAAGLVMAVLPAVGDSIGVDTPADAEAVERILLNEAAAGETGGTSEAREAGGER